MSGDVGRNGWREVCWGVGGGEERCEGGVGKCFGVWGR